MATGRHALWVERHLPAEVSLVRGIVPRRRSNLVAVLPGLEDDEREHDRFVLRYTGKLGERLWGAAILVRARFVLDPLEVCEGSVIDPYLSCVAAISR